MLSRSIITAVAESLNFFARHGIHPKSAHINQLDTDRVLINPPLAPPSSNSPMSLPRDLWYQRYWEHFSLVFYPKLHDQKVISEPNAIAMNLLPIIARHGDYAIVEALAKYVGRAAHTYPRDIDSIAKTLALIYGKPGFPNVTIYKPRKWTGRLKTTYGAAMSICLGEVIDDGLEDAYAEDEGGQGDLRIAPDNIRLTSAVFSASAIKYGLQTPEKAVATTKRGFEDGAPEVFAVMACLQLAISGDRMQSFLEETLPEGDIGVALGKLKVGDTVKNPEAIELLNVS